MNHMNKIAWTNGRLKRLYAHYNRRYWKDKLASFSVINEPPPSEGDVLGFCDHQKQTIYVNVAAHQSDRAVREHPAPRDGSCCCWPKSSFRPRLQVPRTDGASSAVGCARLCWESRSAACAIYWNGRASPLPFVPCSGPASAKAQGASVVEELDRAADR